MGDLGSTSLLYAARPSISVEGAEEPALADALLALSVCEDTGGLYALEATFGNWGPSRGSVSYLYFDRALFDFGRRIAVELGDGEAAGTVFDGRVTALEGRYPGDRTPEIRVLAEDRLQDLRMVRRTRTFEDVSDADVAREVASAHGLSAEVDADGPSYRVLAQVNQSDLAFLRDRARAVDAELWIEGDVLHLQARARRRTSEVSLTYGKGLREFRAAADLAEQRTEVTVGGWDVQAKEALAESAGPGALGSEARGSSGPQLLESAFGPRAETLVHRVPLSTPEAQVLAEAHLRHTARRFVTGRGVAEGDARIRVGTELELQELGELFDGRYYVAEVRHSFDPEEGFRTAFTVERAGLGGF